MRGRNPALVAVDATVLINLSHVGRFDILASLQQYRFVAPEEAIKEVTRSEQRELVQQALDHGWLQSARLDAPGDLPLFLQLRGRIGAGESACLVVAHRHTGVVASDDRRSPFLRAIRELLGPDRLMTTPGIVLLAVRSGVLAVEAADAFLPVWAEQRFKVALSSFRERL